MIQRLYAISEVFTLGHDIYRRSDLLCKRVHWHPLYSWHTHSKFRRVFLASFNNFGTMVFEAACACCAFLLCVCLFCSVHMVDQLKRNSLHN